MLAAPSAVREEMAMSLGHHARRMGEVTGDDRIAMRVAEAGLGSEGLDERSPVLIEVALPDAVRAFRGGAAE